MLLAGVVNQLSSGGTPVKIEPPAWITREEVEDTRDDLALARAVFKEFVGQKD